MIARREMREVTNKSLGRTLRLAACATSAALLFSFGLTLENFRYWLSTFGTGRLLAAGPDSSLFDISDGRIDNAGGGRFEVSTKEMRATIRGTIGKRVRVHFTYLGPTQELSRLADGSVRHQFVLALQAKNICNRVYIGWHFLSPGKQDQLIVQVKSNPGKASHADCGDSGYQTVSAFSVPAVRVNQEHTFEAFIQDRRLVVITDGATRHVKLPDVAFTFDGPVALRTDNAHVVFSYEAD
jgi:hypothetical protein